MQSRPANVVKSFSDLAMLAGAETVAPIRPFPVTGGLRLVGLPRQRLRPLLAKERAACDAATD